MWLTPHEQRTLAVLALIGFAGLGVLLWQRQPSALSPILPDRRSGGWAVRPGGTPLLTIAGTPVVRDGMQWNTALDASRRMDVNTAGVAELERLPEVGPSLARRIAAYREAHGPFGSPEDLMDVPGIGPKTYDVLKDYVSAE